MSSDEMKVTYGAYHEAGHIVVAAVLGLVIRPDGLMVASTSEALAMYASRPENSDDSRERVVLVTFAGYWAGKHFCAAHSRTDLLDPLPELSHDWREARCIIKKFSPEYIADGNLSTVQLKLETKSKHLVEEHWSAIDALALALMAKTPEPMKPLQDGTAWLNEEPLVRYLPGLESARCRGDSGDALCAVWLRDLVPRLRSEWVAGIGGPKVKVSVADVCVEHEVELAEFTKWLERPGGSPREVIQKGKIKAILGMLPSQ